MDRGIVSLSWLCRIDKVADYNSHGLCLAYSQRELIGHTFTRFALPITWDFTELAVTNDVGGAYPAQLGLGVASASSTLSSLGRGSRTTDG